MQHRLTSKLAADHRRLAAIALSACVALCGAGAPVFAAPTLDQLAADFDLSKDDVQRVRDGELVKTTAKETTDRELAVAMLFLVKTPVQKLVAALKAGPSSRNDPQVQSVSEISGEGALVVADRDFYVSSGYNDTQAVAGLLPVENGTVVVYLNRTTTDQLGGFGASAKQAIGRGMMAKQISAIFEKARAGFKDK